MTPRPLEVVLIVFAVFAFGSAVVIANRAARSLWNSFLTIALRTFVAALIAYDLEQIHLLVWIGLEKGIDEVKELLVFIATNPSSLLLIGYRWTFVRCFSLGACAVLVDSTAHTWRKRVIRVSIAVGLMGSIVQILLPERLTLERQPTNFFLLSACVLESPVIGIVVALTGRFLEKLRMTKILMPIIALVRNHQKISIGVCGIILLAAPQVVPRTSRIFLTFSEWREITAAYSEVAATKNSPVSVLLHTVFNSWLVATGDNMDWVSFKSAKKELYFTFLNQEYQKISDRKIELIVSRVNDSPFRDEFLYYRHSQESDFRRQLVFQGEINSGTFVIEAPEFACATYSLADQDSKSHQFDISVPLRERFTVTKEVSPTIVPGQKEVTKKEWISVRTSGQTLGVNTSAAKEVMMYCRGGRYLSKDGPGGIKISGKELANPIVIGVSDGVLKDKSELNGMYPGFVIEIKRPDGRVSIGVAGNAASMIGIGGSNLRLLDGTVSAVTVRQPKGNVKIDADEARELNIMDEFALTGENLKFSSNAGGEITVQGQSRDITLNGSSLTKPIAPAWLPNFLGMLQKVFGK